MIEIKKRLVNHPHIIESLLYYYGFDNVKVGSKEIRCAIDEQGNGTSIRIKLDENLTANDWVREYHGDIFTIIMKCKNVSLKDIIRKVKSELGIDYIQFGKRNKIFGGFYDNIKLRNKQSFKLEKYNEDIMESYLHKYNTLFLRDNISFETQKKFKIGVDLASSRITVPYYDLEGDLIGIEGRYMGDYEKDETPKWFPILPFPKSQILYGYYTNYGHLQGSEVIYIGESSKFCMQLDTMGFNNSVALGGKSIHPQQLKQLSWLNPKKIVFCLDEGLEEEFIISQVDKVKILLKFFDVQVGYVFDENNVIMEEGSKCSPSDLGKINFIKLTNDYIKWR